MQPTIFFLSRCFSPIYNHRSDEYGGLAINRARILVEILKVIRKQMPELHISIKINFHDYMAGGVTPQDAQIACKALVEHGIDYIEISANGTSQTGINPMQNEAYFLDFALELKKAVNIPVILVGGHPSMENMTAILNKTPVEYFSLSRPLIREPDLPKRWQAGDLRPSTCISCNNCYGAPGKRCAYER
ncbi:MAG: old yellow enzyme (OYE)-related binding protein [Firmicutes bacterium]|nr:old yellow enzyme (OYE)-related binding protein [Bacillota bacterium]